MELHFSNTKSVVELKVPKGILFLNTAKVYFGDVDDLESRSRIPRSSAAG